MIRWWFFFTIFLVLGVPTAFAIEEFRLHAALHSSGFAMSGSTGLGETSKVKLTDAYRNFLQELQDRQGSPLCLETGLALYFDPDISKRIINLSMHPIASDPQSGPAKLIIDDYRGGVRVFQRKKLNLALAPVEALSELPLVGTLEPIMGLLPIIGGNIVAMQVAESPNAIQQLPPIKVPVQADAIDSWRVGDHISYEGTGGVLFSVGMGAALLAAAELRYIAIGEWIVTVEKIAEKVAYVKLTKKKLHSFSQKLSTTVFSFENSLFGRSDQAFSFAFDLTNAEAQEAYAAMLHGNLTLAEALAETPSDSVLRVQHIQSKVHGNLFRFSLGTPLAARVAWKNGWLHAHSEIESFQDGSFANLYYGMYQREREIGGLLTSYRRSGSEFYSALIRHWDPSGKSETSYWGQYLWTFERETAQVRHLKKALQELIRAVGFGEALSFELPETKVGYSKMTFRILFPGTAVDRLLENGYDSNEEIRFQKIGQQFLQRYFSTGQDPDQLCGDLLQVDNPGGDLTLIDFSLEERVQQNLARCKIGFENETRRHIHELIKILRLMAEWKGRDEKKFVEYFAKIGKPLQQNRFILQSFVEFIGKNQLQTTYEIEGERISRYTRPLQWSNP